ncbi:MAG: ABC transporter ATP-binding protein [Chthoniobacterales bacterium]|nr:ABC transporter ATP-binding protein [Chthoniobacterales bacterium]
MNFPQPLLQACHLHKNFGGQQSIIDLSFHINEKECLGIIGPNGAGKTTLFNLITGMVPASSGIILWQGHPIEKKSGAQLARLGIARTFQNIRLFKQLSVLENIQIAYDSQLTYSVLGSLFSFSQKNLQEKKSIAAAMDLLAMFEMTDVAHEPASSLPYGFQRRLEIARALALNPRLLLLDEPVAGMNSTEAAKIMELLRWIQKEFSSTLLIIEHHLPFIMELCNRLLVLNFGSLIADGAPSQIKTNPAVISAYLGNDNDSEE